MIGSRKRECDLTKTPGDEDKKNEDKDIKEEKKSEGVIQEEENICYLSRYFVRQS